MNFSIKILKYMFKYFDNYKDVEKFENINNKLNNKLRLLYKFIIFKFKLFNKPTKLCRPSNMSYYFYYCWVDYTSVNKEKKIVKKKYKKSLFFDSILVCSSDGLHKTIPPSYEFISGYSN